MKNINPLKAIALLLILVTVICGYAYDIFGSYIRDDGLLVEPFYLIGVGTFSFVLGLLLFLIALVGDLRKKKK